MRGQTVCKMHGGMAPQSLAKAEELMKSLVRPAIATLSELIAKQDLAAAKYVLDYAGFKATERVQATAEVRTVRWIDVDEQPLAVIEHGYGDSNGRTER